MPIKQPEAHALTPTPRKVYDPPSEIRKVFLDTSLYVYSIRKVYYAKIRAESPKKKHFPRSFLAKKAKKIAACFMTPMTF